MVTGRVRPRLGRSSALGLVLAACGVALSLLPGTLVFDESVGLASLFALRGSLPAPAGVAVVSISRDAAAGVGQTSELDEWPRELHAALIERLAGAGVATVAFDVIFDERREPAADRRLAEAIAAAGNVLLLERLESDLVPLAGGIEAVLDRRVLPLPELKAGALASAPFILPTVPVRVGQFWTFGRGTEDTPSLPVVALQAYLLPHYEDFVRLLDVARPGGKAAWPRTRAEIDTGRNLEQVMSVLRATFQREPGLAAAARAALGREVAASAATVRAVQVLLDLYGGPSSRYLNYYGPARTVRTFPYDGAWRGEADDGVAGKALFVGFSETRQPEQQDDFYSVFSLQTGINLSGVEVGATAFANLLEQSALVPLPMSWHLLLIVLFGAGLGALLAQLSTHRALLAAAAIAVAYVLVAYWQFAAHYVWLPLLVPLLVQLPMAVGVVLWWNYRELLAQRERVSTALGYYVPAAVARRLAAQGMTMGANRQLLHGTCLFTDAEQYTAVAESLRPDELAALMNDYYRMLFRVVEEYGGEISDTAGDSMVAVWASADPDAAARTRAVRAALAILEAVRTFNDEHGGRRLPTRVGLESGEVLLGNIGAEQRYEYRAIGDIVNTAARIQALNQVLGTRVLVSAATLAGTSGLRVREIGAFLLRGKRLPVRVYEPLEAAVVALDAAALAEFAAALTLLQQAEWGAARVRFAALAARHPEDGPCRYYHALVTQYASQPPAVWAGAVSISVK